MNARGRIWPVLSSGVMLTQTFSSSAPIEIVPAEDDDGAAFKRRNLGIAHDVVSIGAHSATWGFSIAKMVTDTGFNIANTCIQGSAELLEKTVGENAVSSSLSSVSDVVRVAHRATRATQDVAELITHASLSATQASLAAAGAQRGELLRLTVGTEYAEAVLALEELVRRFTGPLREMPLPRLLAAANAWSTMQRAADLTDVHSIQELSLPPNAERLMRYCAATFGAMWLAGFIDGISALERVRVATMAGKAPGDVALACAGIHGDVEILAFEQSTHLLYAPGYMVAVDYDMGYVLVAFRGTSSIADALADLDCSSMDISLGGMEGSAHGGMWKVAERLDDALTPLAQAGLQKLSLRSLPLRLLLTGHSLGAGVAALLAARWRDSSKFESINVRCVSFACPQVLDLSLSVATSNFITSVILGDDLVPRLSLATAHDLRDAMLHLHRPQDYNLDDSFKIDEVLAAAERGETERLAQSYTRLRSLACTSPGRLYPPGQLVQLRAGTRPQLVGPQAFDELIVSRDMAAAHMPHRYLAALKEASVGEAANNTAQDQNELQNLN